MALTTPRYALRYPVAADANNVPSDLLNLATDLDNKMSGFISGTIASRPAASISGRFFYATDTKDLSYDTGSAWRSVTGQPVIPMARYYATATPGSTATPVAAVWSSTTFNRNGMPAAPFTKLVMPITGYWMVRAQARWNVGGAGAGGVILQIHKGPNSDTAGTIIASAQRSAEWTFAYDNDVSASIETRVQMNAGDDCAVWHGATPNSTLYGSSVETFLEAELVSVT